MVPPGFSIDAASSNISFCLAAHIFTWSSLHCFTASSSLRNIPSPEQGASTAIRSKNCTKNFARLPASSFVTTQFPTPIRSMFWERIFARPGWISLDRRKPSPFNLEAMWLDFPPGAAHRSSMFSPGFGSKSSTTAIALGSWI